MSNDQSPPIEIHQIGLNPAEFHYSDKKSWRGPCPNCAGHRRFVLFTDNPWPLYHGYCDLCGYKIKAWEKVKAQFDPQKAAAIQAQRERDEAERAEYRRAKLAEFTTHELWLEQHARMTEEHIDWWESQGIPKGIQDYLRIGYTPEKKFYNDEKVLLSAAAFTIPWFGMGFQFQTMQYRLLGDFDRKYIFEDGLGGRFYYMTEPDQPIKDKVIICEGAKKAIVTQFWLAPEGYTVLAAPSANTFDAALEATKDCGLRYIIHDPDVKPYWINKAIATGPKATHAIRLPFKIDDAWMKYNLDREVFAKILETAL